MRCAAPLLPCVCRVPPRARASSLLNHSVCVCVCFGVYPARLDITRQVDNMVHSVGLRSKRHAFARTLSGGQQRKLSVAIAFVGGSKVGASLDARIDPILAGPLLSQP